MGRGILLQYHLSPASLEITFQWFGNMPRHFDLPFSRLYE